MNSESAPVTHLYACLGVFLGDSILLFLLHVLLVLKRKSLMSKMKSTKFFHFVTIGCILMLGSQFFDLLYYPFYKHPASGYLYHFGLDLIHASLIVREWRIVAIHIRTLDCPLVTCHWSRPTDIRRRGSVWSFLRIGLLLVFPNCWIPLYYALGDAGHLSDLLCTGYTGFLVLLNVVVSVWLFVIRRRLSYEEFDEGWSLVAASIFSTLQYVADLVLWFFVVSRFGMQYYMIKFLVNVVLIDIIVGVTAGSSLVSLFNPKKNAAARSRGPAAPAAPRIAVQRNPLAAQPASPPASAHAPPLGPQQGQGDPTAVRPVRPIDRLPDEDLDDTML
ncbi:hypothetical protein PAPYR_3123 [Paratrimastix pyriformis]|uniref:Uncharacterized protein n=1 Tax=Paratrimastix pyriformis TaxID=342808 RepID=A0ABQ8UNW0_9EUKA|nr:hypothetical protein PAPYR_3123 [Paratrimastix pyriformis]